MEIFENNIAKIWIENEICFSTYKTNTHLNLQSAISVVEGRLALFNNKFYPVIVDISNIKSIDKNAREFMKSDGYHLISKAAFISNSFVSEAIANYFIQIDQPNKQTLIFQTKEEAITSIITE